MTALETEIDRLEAQIDRDSKALFAYQSLRMPELAHSFIIVLPVADRPLQLKRCLNSLIDWLSVFNQPIKLKVLVAEDSMQANNRRLNRSILANSGLDTVYFSLSEQADYLKKYAAPYCGQGEIRAHKGASITRNLCYLYLHDHARPNQLYWFIDSDQEFKLPLPWSEQPLPALHYFYHLDRLFSQNKIQLLTGKVVGDPPVSPAVMSHSFLTDMIELFKQIESYGWSSPCQLHRPYQPASYHDMADLFDLKQSSTQYVCPLKGPHDHRQCWHDFGRRLHRFFDGEHPSRYTPYRSVPVRQSVQPARTVYTGNYVLNKKGLDYLIPFAEFKLRMAGPSLGRLLKARLGARFVSAALPLLHRRSLDDLDQAEYRSGVNKTGNRIDLSQEFSRQFWGDVLLFSLEKLTEQHYPLMADPDQIRTVLMDRFDFLWHRYQTHRQQIKQKLTWIRQMIPPHESFDHFLNNMVWNFVQPAPAYALIQSQSMQDALIQALIEYPQKHLDWLSLRNQTDSINHDD